MPVSFEFDRRHNDSRRKSAMSKYLRFIVVLCIVAVITAVIIMAIVPNRAPATGNVPGKTPAAEAGVITDDGAVIAPEAPAAPAETPQNKTAGAGASGNNRAENAAADKSGKNSGRGKTPTAVSPAAPLKPEYRKNALPNIHTELPAITNAQPADAVKMAQTLLMREGAAGGEFSENWHNIGQLLTSKRRQALHATAWQHGTENYRVVSGDALERIARKCATTIEAIKMINKLKNSNIRIGQRLKVAKGPWRVTISRKAQMLNLWQKSGKQWSIYAVFPVTVARDNKNLQGKLAISSRLYRPAYRATEGRIFKYGAPENPLGEALLRLSGAALKRGNYGIHGSPEGNAAGRSLDSGFVRMRNADIMILYYLLPVRTPVEIVD